MNTPPVIAPLAPKPVAPIVSVNAAHSTLRERIVEHLFVGETLRCLWRNKVTDVEVLRSEFDAHGYDIVLARQDVVRHIQFKMQASGPISVSLELSKKASGCVILLGVTEDLVLKSFWWFGSEPGQRLPAIEHFPVAKRATRNALGERPSRSNHRLVPRSSFTRISTLDGVVEKLFGEIKATSGAMPA